MLFRSQNLKKKIITESISGFIPSNKKYSEQEVKNKINILYEDFLRKNYKIKINEKQLNQALLFGHKKSPSEVEGL